MSLTTNYSAVKKHQGFSVRGVLRNVALDALSLKDTISKSEKLLCRPRIQFLFIHHIFKDEQAKFDVL